MLFQGLQLAFNKGWAGVETVYQTISMTVPSSTREEQYGWLNQIPDFREWVGPRVVQNVSGADYTIKNRSFELTIGIDRDDIEDDLYGIFSPLFTQMGQRAAEKPDLLMFELLASGFATECYDGQPFFDADHPVQQDENTIVTVSNTQTGAGSPWFLFDTSKAVKPLVFQTRKPFNQLIRKDRPEDDNVFDNKEFRYGMDGRANAGFGLWQLAFGSKATLDDTNYPAARQAMMSMVGDYGRKLGIKPNVLVCGPSNETAALKLLNTEYGDAGASNPWKGTVRLIITPWLA